MPVPDRQLAIPEAIRLSIVDDTANSTPLSLGARRLWPAGLVTGVFFLILAAIAWQQIAAVHPRDVKDVFDLAFLLFQIFWILGWSVGVFILGAVTLLLLAYGESARVQDGRLLYVPRLGPLLIRCEYDLAKIRNARFEDTVAKSRGDLVRLWFDYDGASMQLGDALPRTAAEYSVATLQAASAAALQAPRPVGRQLPGIDLSKWIVRPTATQAGTEEAVVPRKDCGADESTLATPSWAAASVLALIGANLVPVVGVLLGGWNLGEIMVLFWVESAVIGFYNLIKLAFVGKWLAFLAGPFFLGHYGAFMVGHFLFIYYMFVRGIDAASPEEPVTTALAVLFGPLRFAVLMLFVSHGISFVTNFIGRKEYAGVTVNQLMSEPYRRIIVMHLTIIFGGWLVMLLRTPAAALVLLVLLKTVADLRAHRAEHES